MYRSQKDMQDGYAYHQRTRHMKMIDIFLSLACLSCCCHTLGRHVLPFFKNSFRRGSWGWTAYGEEYGIPEVTKRNGICSVEGRLRLGNSWVSLAQLPPESELQSDSPTWIFMTWADSSVRWKMDIQHSFLFFVGCCVLPRNVNHKPTANWRNAPRANGSSSTWTTSTALPGWMYEMMAWSGGMQVSG